MDALPPELILKIFSYLSLRGRLYAVGLVSKRFRMLSLRSIDTLQLECAHVEQALSVIPNITALQTDGPFPFPPFPSTIRSLNVAFSHPADYGPIDFPPSHLLPPCLTSLEFEGPAIVASLVRVLSHLGSSLQQVTLHMRQYFSDELIPKGLASVSMPALRSLAFHYYPLWDDLRDYKDLLTFVRTHASQLTSLEVGTVPWRSMHWQSSSFPF